MQATRRQRLEAVILEELSTVVPREVKDPRVQSVTFTSVQLTEDASHATIFVSLLGGSSPDDSQASKKIGDCIAGLNSASGFLRRYLAKALTVRHIPSLAFREDRGFDNALRVHELLKGIGTTEGGSAGGAGAEGEGGGENDESST